MIIRRVNENELDQALDLVYKVFMEYEAPDYPAEGVESFVNDIIKNEGFKEGCITGKFKMYGAFDGDAIIGILSIVFRKFSPNNNRPRVGTFAGGK